MKPKLRRMPAALRVMLRSNDVGWRKCRAKLDNIFFRRTGPVQVNPNTHQKFIFCARQHMAAGLALYICPGRPGVAS